MAVLAHMSFDHDQFVSTYSSEPVLTFGAARVWYAASGPIAETQASCSTIDESSCTEDEIQDAEVVLPRLQLSERNAVYVQDGQSEVCHDQTEDCSQHSDGSGASSDESSDAESLFSEDIDPIESVILPEFRKMCHQEVLDTGGIGELVAQIILLLVMDATGVIVTGDEKNRCYDGTFYQVTEFFQAFVVDNVVSAHPTDVKELLKTWEDWKVCFSHFVQLSEEPTEDVLWAMLARRSACMLSRGFKGIDLLIPIFKDEDVSMILVQVKNRQVGDSKFPESAVISTRPSVVFKSDLQRKKPEEVIRIYMPLRGTDPMKRFFVVDPGFWRSSRLKSSLPGLPCLAAVDGWTNDDYHCSDEDTTGVIARAGDSRMTEEPTTAALTSTILPQSTPPVPIVLCLAGLEGWDAQWEGHTVQVVSDGLASQLVRLLTPWWDLEKLVGSDLSLRKKKKRFGMEGTAIKQIAVAPLVETLLFRKYDLITQPRNQKRKLKSPEQHQPASKRRLKLTSPNNAVMTRSQSKKRAVKNAKQASEDDTD